MWGHHLRIHSGRLIWCSLVSWTQNWKRNCFLICLAGNNLKNALEWRYPPKSDECRVDVRQIISLKPQYEWDLSVRNPTLTLKNHREVYAKVQAAELINFWSAYILSRHPSYPYKYGFHKSLRIFTRTPELFKYSMRFMQGSFHFLWFPDFY